MDRLQQADTLLTAVLESPSMLPADLSQLRIQAAIALIQLDIAQSLRRVAIDADIDNVKLRGVLGEIARTNPLYNDKKAYVNALIQWALGASNHRPTPEEFGIA